MGSLDSAITFAENRHATRCVIWAPACTKARHQGSTCSACADACPAGAISFPDGLPHVAKSLCVGCGTCRVVCPTQAPSLPGFGEGVVRAALDSLRPADPEFLHSASPEPPGPADQAVLICNRALEDKGLIPPSELAVKRLRTADGESVLALVIPCLAAVGESQLLIAATRSAKVRLVSPGCDGCPQKSCCSVLAETLESTQKLANQWGISTPVTFEENPATAHGIAHAFNQGSTEPPSRRGAIDQVVSEAKSLAIDVAQEKIDRSPAPQEQKSLSQILEMINGALPWIPVPRHEDLLELLYASGVGRQAAAGNSSATAEQPAAASQADADGAAGAAPQTTAQKPVGCNRFGIVTATDACDCCGICASFCPTGALRLIGQPAHKPKMGIPVKQTQPPALEFRSCDCVGCGLCADICPTGALSISHEVTPAQLLELKPTRLKG